MESSPPTYKARDPMSIPDGILLSRILDERSKMMDERSKILDERSKLFDTRLKFSNPNPVKKEVKCDLNKVYTHPSGGNLYMGTRIPSNLSFQKKSISVWSVQCSDPKILKSTELNSSTNPIDDRPSEALAFMKAAEKLSEPIITALQGGEERPGQMPYGDLQVGGVAIYSSNTSSWEVIPGRLEWSPGTSKMRLSQSGIRDRLVNSLPTRMNNSPLFVVKTASPTSVASFHLVRSHFIRPHQIRLTKIAACSTMSLILGQNTGESETLHLEYKEFRLCYSPGDDFKAMFDSLDVHVDRSTDIMIEKYVFKNVSSFINAKISGTLRLGITDNGTVIGIPTKNLASLVLKINKSISSIIQGVTTEIISVDPDQFISFDYNSTEEHIAKLEKINRSS